MGDLIFFVAYPAVLSFGLLVLAKIARDEDEDSDDDDWWG